MEPGFWRQRWQEGRIGFHEGKPNSYLAKHIDVLDSCRRIFVPLCGKTEDLAFLASRGHRVIGVELVEDAVRAFFAEHALTPEIEQRGAYALYRTPAIEIACGDVLAVTREVIGTFDSIYDRGALVALPPELRPRYAANLRALSAPGTPMIVVALEYPQDQWQGPPFSVPEAEVRGYYRSIDAVLAEAPDPRVREGAPPMLERCFAVTVS